MRVERVVHGIGKGKIYTMKDKLDLIERNIFKKVFDIK